KLRSFVIDDLSQFIANISQIQEINGTATIPLYNYNSQRLNLQIGLLGGSKARVKILEEQHTRYELSDVLDKDPTVLPFDVANLTKESVILVPQDPLEHYVVVVNAGPPFTVEFYLDNQLKVVLNAKRLIVENTSDSQAFNFDVEFEGATKLYGLHHHSYKLALDETADGSKEPFRLRNSDVYDLNSTMALYGSVPVLYGHSVNGTSGIFFHNAAEEWIDISYKGDRPSAHFMVESGTFDMFVLFGPTTQAVVRQFTNLTGVAHLPQLWTLGYHQCRWSYNSQEDVKYVVAEMDNHDFPMDAIWLDIDYTDEKRYFTWNPESFSDPIEMQKNLSTTNRKLVTILDPHIKVDDNYPVYAGAKGKYFVKWANGSDFEGTCWPGVSNYLDFLNPEVRDYYVSWYAYNKFNGSTETLAGVWNDMNEPSVFDTLEKTMPFEAVHYNNVLHRDIHNIYGLLQTKATHQGLILRDNGTKRPFILSRSHFAGSQRYAAMWTGDNTADWPYLVISYSECMLSNIVGMVFCGADVGGFSGNPDHELLQRWYQAGVWLPFYRGHATQDSPRREPYLFPEDVQAVIRNAIKMRYKHIPVFYTLFYEHTRYGDPVIKPVFYDYPEYLEYDGYILVGSDILARPVLEPGISSQTVEFPGNEETFWYRVDNGSWVVHLGSSRTNLPVNISTSPFFYRGGSIIPRKNKERPSTANLTDDPYTLYVNLDANRNAEGRLYVDDYTSFAYSTDNTYFYVNITYISESNRVHI
ncbi:hypothetical protein NQ318_016196, partial [Aromia moschata]